MQELDVDDPLEGSGLLGGVDEGVRPLNLELGRRFEVVLQLDLKKKKIKKLNWRLDKEDHELDSFEIHLCELTTHQKVLSSSNKIGLLYL